MQQNKWWQVIKFPGKGKGAVCGMLMVLAHTCVVTASRVSILIVWILPYLVVFRQCLAGSLFLAQELVGLCRTVGTCSAVRGHRLTQHPPK